MKISIRQQPVAFTLVEVVLAVTIASTVLLGLFGLVPVGLDNMRQSAINAAHTRIVQTMTATCQMMDWQRITSSEYASKLYKFDFQGVNLEQPKEEEVGFLVKVDVADAMHLPGRSQSNPYMRNIVIRVVEGTNESLFDTLRERRFFAQIAQMDDNQAQAP